MASPIANVSLANTFPDFVDRFNEAATVISTRVVTVDNSANGDVTSGNCYIDGIVGALTIAANTLRGGTVDSPSDLNITGNVHFQSDFYSGNSTVNAVFSNESITLANSTVSFEITRPTSGQVSDGNYFLNANGEFAQVIIPEDTPQQINTSGTSAQLFDSFEISTYQSAKYFYQIKSNNINAHSLGNIMVTYCGNSSPLITEYGILDSNGSLGVASANANSTHVRVYFAPTSTDTTIKMRKTYI